MTFVVLALFALAVLLPLLFMLRGGLSARSRRESALAIHRAQLAELDRDLADGRIAPSEHASAVLEVQRRLLAAGATAEPAVGRASRAPLIATLLLIPLVAVGLYALNGQPEMPAMPLAGRVSEEQQADVLIARLRERLATLDPTSEKAREGYVLLGNAEDSRGHLSQAALAWRHAVAIRFEPALAVLTAEAQTRVEGRVSKDSAALFRRALAEGPPDAPWRKLAEQRLAQAVSTPG